VEVVSNSRPYKVSAFGGWFEGFLFEVILWLHVASNVF